MITMCAENPLSFGKSLLLRYIFFGDTPFVDKIYVSFETSLAVFCVAMGLPNK